jgi:DNA-binding NarL/FixJ family response regulator
MHKIIAFNPLEDVRRFEESFNRLFSAPALAPTSNNIPIDVTEQDGKVMIRAAVPGIAPEELAEAIRTIHRGGSWIPDEIARALSDRDSCAELSPRELEVLRLLIKGLTNPDICQLLGISLGTVKAHIRNILAKLQVGDRTEAAAEAYRRGLVE